MDGSYPNYLHAELQNIGVLVETGGLFHPEDDKQEVAFRYAVERVNADRAVLPRAKLLAQVETISPQDSFHASKRGKRQ